MNIDELWNKYATLYKNILLAGDVLMTKKCFTEAIAEIISQPLEAKVMPTEGLAGEIKARVDELQRISRLRLEYKDEYLGEWDIIMIDYLEKRTNQIKRLSQREA